MSFAFHKLMQSLTELLEPLLGVYALLVVTVSFVLLALCMFRFGCLPVPLNLVRTFYRLAFSGETVRTAFEEARTAVRIDPHIKSGAQESERFMLLPESPLGPDDKHNEVLFADRKTVEIWPSRKPRPPHSLRVPALMPTHLLRLLGRHDASSSDGKTELAAKRGAGVYDDGSASFRSLCDGLPKPPKLYLGREFLMLSAVRLRVP